MPVLEESCSLVPGSKATVKTALRASTRLGLESFLCHCCDVVRVLCFFCPVRLQELKLRSEQLGEVVVLLRAGELFCSLGLNAFFKILSLVPTQIYVDAEVGTSVSSWALLI